MVGKSHQRRVGSAEADHRYGYESQLYMISLCELDIQDSKDHLIMPLFQAPHTKYVGSCRRDQGFPWIAQPSSTIFKVEVLAVGI